MAKRELFKPNYVYGRFELKGGRLTFRTSDPGLLGRLRVDRDMGRASSVCLFAADPYQEFTGRHVSAELVKVERPQE